MKNKAGFLSITKIYFEKNKRYITKLQIVYASNTFW